MRKRKWGRIVFISSVNAHKGAMGATHYDATKAGMIGFATALAHESGALGITVNAVAPGLIDTDMIAPASQEWKDNIIVRPSRGADRHRVVHGRGVVPQQDVAGAVLVGVAERVADRVELEATHQAMGRLALHAFDRDHRPDRRVETLSTGDRVRSRDRADRRVRQSLGRWPVAAPPHETPTIEFPGASSRFPKLGPSTSSPEMRRMYVHACAAL